MTNSNNRIAIIVGAGAVENAWQPILDAFKLLWRREVDTDGANFLFAKHIFLLRAYSKFKDALSIKNLNNELEQVNTLKEVICHCLTQAQERGVIRPRKEFITILDKFVFSDLSNMFCFITTNWDTVIDEKIKERVKIYYDHINNAQCFHLHGSVNSPNSLYLPSEIGQENYRSDKEDEEFGVNHLNTTRSLKEAHQIILYGISLDPLDAELSQVLNSAFTTSDNLKEIIIINPDYNKIKNRIQFLLFPRTDIKVKCYVPENLNQELQPQCQHL